MKIKIKTQTVNKPVFDANDIIPQGLYIDALGDVILVSSAGILVFSVGVHNYVSAYPSWPISPAPAGTTVELTA